MAKKNKPLIFVDGHGDVREVVEWPKVIKGSHSTRIEHEDGRVEFYTDWEALKRDVRNAILEYESNVSDKTKNLLTDTDEPVKIIKTKPLRTKKSKNET